MEVLSVACNSTVGELNIPLRKGECIPVTRDRDGRCVLHFRDSREEVIVHEEELYSCGFVVKGRPAFFD